MQSCGPPGIEFETNDIGINQHVNLQFLNVHNK